MSNLLALLLTCAPAINAETLNAVIRTESHYNPYAIAIVDGDSIKQPRSKDEAINVLARLEQSGANYSLGIAQINKSNFGRYNVTAEELLNPCTNIRIAEKILLDCYSRSPAKKVAEALSCYYAGNFRFGFVKEAAYKNTAYLERILANHQPRSEIVGSIAVERDYVADRISANVQKKNAVKLSVVAKPSQNKKSKVIKSLPESRATVQQADYQPKNASAFRF